jgi:hypothetical protein
MRTALGFLVLAAACAAAGPAPAQTFPLVSGQDLIGEIAQTEAQQQDTLPDIARQHHLGFDEIIAANPGVDIWLPGAGIRLYPEDIEVLFGEVKVGTSVRIVNQRIKTGWLDGALYLEVHHPLDGTDPREIEDATALTRAIVAATANRRVKVDWDAAQRVFEQANGAAPKLLGTRNTKKNAAVLPAALKLDQILDYFDTDFLNMRSIFSLIASMAVEFDCPVDSA